MGRSHLVGLRRHDQPVHLFDAPVLLHQLDGQPVQKLRMRRTLAHLADVIRCREDAAAEVVLPDAVRGHARRQRILVGDDPLRQCQAAPGGDPPVVRRLGIVVALTGQRRQQPRLNFGPFVAVVRVRQEVGRRRTVGPAHDGNPGTCVRIRLTVALAGLDLVTKPIGR